ncbi:MAG: DUF2029 domain-containing protein [Rhizobiaceae bacterium]|nr:DUF2029 domain-containing protein [Rhizobiaceae bacterium]
MTDRQAPITGGSDWVYAAIVVAAGLLFGLTNQYHLWTLDENGFSVLSERLPYWDFTNLWAGSKMALNGNAAALFDAELYRAALRAMLSPLLPDQEWSYPPSMALIGAPLAQLPIFPAYLVWTFGTIACLFLAIRPLGLPLAVQIAAAVSPAVLVNTVFGQNGALTGALLIGGLLAVQKRPILAGVLFGLLTIKPHLGILVPVCLLASCNWRAFGSAAVTTVLVALATGFAFGFDTWPMFLANTSPLMTAIMEAPYPQPYHANAMTVFIAARSIGASVSVAYAAQLAATLAAASFVIWLWRPSNPVEFRMRALLTATLAIVATPYGYSYDAIPLCVAVAFLLVTVPKPPVTFLAFLWLSPLAIHLLHQQGTGFGVLFPVSLCVWMGMRCLNDVRSAQSATAADEATRSERSHIVAAELR